MGKDYCCELCGKIFEQKCDYDRHKNKKSPCVSIEKIEEIVQQKKENNDTKTGLATLFKNCLDMLRDKEHLIGDKALRTLAHLLDLRLLEQRFKDEIDIENYDGYDFSKYDYPEDVLKKYKQKLFEVARFSNLAKQKEDDIPKMMKGLWDDILSVHPKTKNIFLKDKGFDITHKTTYKKIIDKLNDYPFEKTEADILGDAYGTVVSDVMTGKTLGQFFTPHKVTKMMVKLLDPQIKKDGKVETVFDPAMGTGGFLISSIRYYIEEAKKQKIKLDWNFISNGGIGGREAEPDTYQLAISNMLISTGHMFSTNSDVNNNNYDKKKIKESLQRGDSIRYPITEKYDMVLANPPFGIKGLDYSEITSGLRDEYMPIKTDSAVPLFLQAIIYMLKINGKCAVVLPEGQELFSKNATLVAIREFLMKSCDLKEIIQLPAGIFSDTTIKTCIFFFVKKKEGSDILDVSIKKNTNTNKETKREYKFSKSHQTSKVKFYDYNPEKDEKFLLLEVDIKDLEKNGYSLNYNDYIKDEKDDEKYGDDIEIKTLDDICEINFGTRIVKKDNTDGEYPVYGSGRDTFTTNTFNREGFNILIGRFALSEQCVRLVEHKLFLNDSGLTIKPKKNILMHKFLGYYIFTNQKIIYNCARGTAQKNLDIERFKKIKIPIPELEKQKEIVEYLDFIYEKCIKSSNEKISELEKLNKYYLEMQKKYGNNEILKLGDVSEIQNGKRIVKDQVETGDYPVYGGGGLTSFYTNTYTREGKTCKISREGMSLHNCVLILNEKYYLNSQALTIISNNQKKIINEYLWYYLLNSKQIIFDCGRGTAQKAIDMEKFQKIKIPTPSVEKQKEIVEYCEYNQNLIKQLEKEIEQNKKRAEEFMNTLIKNTKKKNNIENNDSSDDDNDGDSDNNDEKIKNVKEEKKVEKSDEKKENLYNKIFKSESESENKKEKESSENEKKKVKKVVKVEKKESIKKKIIESESESDSDSESDYEWDDKTLEKIKKSIDDEEKLKSIRRKENIPKDIFNDKVKELQKKSK
jgi:type I restriction enzyme S subunit